jgi:hypothetical protein
VSFTSDSPCKVLRTDFSSFCKPFACCFHPVVVWVLVVCHHGLFLWYNLGSDLLMLGRPGRMTLRRTPVAYHLHTYIHTYIHSDEQTLHKPTTWTQIRERSTQTRSNFIGRQLTPTKYLNTEESRTPWNKFTTAQSPYICEQIFLFFLQAFRLLFLPRCCVGVGGLSPMSVSVV